MPWLKLECCRRQRAVHVAVVAQHVDGGHRPSSVTVAVSSPATGASFTALTVTFTVAVAVRPSRH